MKAMVVALIPFMIGSFLLACNETSLQDGSRPTVSEKAEASTPAVSVDESEAVNIPLPVTGS